MRIAPTAVALIVLTSSLPSIAQDAGSDDAPADERLADDGQVQASPDERAEQADNAGRPMPGAADEQDVCADYGTGYTPISGTETCLRIGGYLRVDAGAGDLNGLDLGGGPNGVRDGDADAWNTNARFAFNTYTSTETSYGALNTFSEIRFNYGNSVADDDATGLAVQDSDSDISVNFAWIELAGLRVGKSETLFDTFTGYGGAVINDATIGGYGPFDTNLLSYGWTSDTGLEAAISLEQGSQDWLMDGYVPHVVLAAGQELGTMHWRASLAYDTRDGAGGAGGGVAAKARADVELNDTTSVFGMLLFGENASGYTSWATGGDEEETASIIAGHTLAHRESLASNSQLQWAQGNSGNTVLNAVVNVALSVVPGLTLTPELQWARDNEGESAYGAIFRAQAAF